MAKTLRELIRELRRLHVQGPVQKSSMYIYMMEQYRAHLVTGAKFCKEQDEMKHLAETYLCLLQSSRKLEELGAQYSRGDRSITDSAHLVGLKLPYEK